jgi:hypothetical protein
MNDRRKANEKVIDGIENKYFVHNSIMLRVHEVPALYRMVGKSIIPI